jgi:hypothetical protein
VGTLPLAIATRGLVTLTLIPLAWTVVFVAWAGVSAGIFDAATGAGSGVVRALMGPGLFLAGLVVMLAVTKRVLSMASFGLPLAVPGVGIVRSTVRSAVTREGSKALLDAGESARGKAAEEAGDRMNGAPTKGGSGQPIRPRTPAPQPTAQGATGSGRAQRFRTLFEGGGAGSSRNDEYVQRHQPVQNADSDREEQTRDAAAVAGMRRGAFRSRTPMRAEYKAFEEQVHAFESASGDAPTDRAQQAEEGHTQAAASAAGAAANTSGVDDRVAGRAAGIQRLVEVGREVPGGDRSAIGGLAREAIENNPDNPAAAKREYRHGMINQYAGVEMHPKQREAFAFIASQPPAETAEAYRRDYERFQWRQERGGKPPTGSYDPALFRFGR